MIGQDTNTESLMQFRNNTKMIIGWVVAPFLFPFAIYNLALGNTAPSLLALILVVLLLANSFYIYYRNELIPFFHTIFFIVLLTALVVAIHFLGTKALFWCYPSLFVQVFMMELVRARVQMIICLVVLIPFTFYTVSNDVAIRFALTIIMTCCFSDILFGRILKLQSMLTEIAIRDPLTNMYNRRHLEQYLNEAIEGYGRGFGAISLILIDIDGFKSTNDTHGHEAGDQILKNLSTLLFERLRKLDYIFRIGGDEFLVLLRNTNEQQAILSAESFRKHIEENNLIEEDNITISLGVAEYKVGETTEQWMNRVDKNLYKAKELGRNTVFPNN